ncbi:MAG: PqqD family protein [Acidobacteriota bacterium]
MENAAQRALPRAREKGLVTCEVAGELLVYDLERHKAHCLNLTAGLVWRQCDGRTAVPEITRAVNVASALGINDDAVWFALEQLGRAHLIDKTFERRDSRKLTRRELINRAGIAAAAALPLITSIMAPSAVEAASCLPPNAGCSPTGPNSSCCNGICIAGLCN